MDYLSNCGQTDEAQAGIKIAGEISIISDMQMTPLKSLLMKVKEENEKAGLKLNNQETRSMTSNPITSWQTKGEKVETVTDFIFLDSKSTADTDCIHDIKRCLLLGRKAMTNLGSL